MKNAGAICHTEFHITVLMHNPREISLNGSMGLKGDDLSLVIEACMEVKRAKTDDLRVDESHGGQPEVARDDFVRRWSLALGPRTEGLLPPTDRSIIEWRCF